MPMRTRRSTALVFVAAFLLTSCGASTPSAVHRSSVARGSGAKSSSAATHIVVIVMENHEYPKIIGSSDAPYINALATDGVLLTSEYAVTHPSLPNYLALTGGSTFGITSDCTDCNVKARNLVDQFAANGISWKAYMETMPDPCFKGSFAGSAPGEYAKKHDPFMYFDDVRNRPKRCRLVVPFSRFRRDLKARLPQFVWITPNECHDMHSCSVATGDAWLKKWVPRIVPALGSNGIVIVLFDEGTSDATCCSMDSGGGHVAAIIAGPGAKAGEQITSDADHYSILRLIEDEWGLKRLGSAADTTTPSVKGWKA
jgi:phosphatidylinositol-3-phosphatase